MKERGGRGGGGGRDGGDERERMARALAQTYGRSLGEKFGPLSEKSVRAGWRLKRNSAATRGTTVHRNLELYYNDEPFPDPEMPEVAEIFPQILRDFPELDRSLVFRTELSIEYRPLLMTGQPDVLFRSTKTPGAFFLADWKNSQNIWKRTTVAKDFRAAFPDVDSQEAGMYGLQLNLYAFMLTRAGFVIDEMALFVLHPDHVGCRKIPVPFMPRETFWLLERHTERVVRILLDGVDDAPHVEPPSSEDEEGGDAM
jgi:hypothetical protein